MTKAEQRKILEQHMAAFVANGGAVTQCTPKHKPRFEKKEEVVEEVEIDVSALPPALQAKFFPEEV